MKAGIASCLKWQVLHRRERIHCPKEVSLRPEAGAFEQRILANLRSIKRFAQTVGNDSKKRVYEITGLLGDIMRVAERKGSCRIGRCEPWRRGSLWQRTVRHVCKNFS
jgi:hypothetical protein